MKTILNTLLALSLLVPAIAVANEDVQGAEVEITTAEMNNATEASFDITTQEQVDAARVAKFNAAMPSNKQIQAKTTEVAQQGRLARGYQAVKSAVTSASSYVFGGVKNAGLYGLSKAQAVKGFVATEWSKAQGVKGVSLFAAKALVGTSLTAAVLYAIYKGVPYAYNKAKAVTKKSTKKKKKMAVRRLA